MVGVFNLEFECDEQKERANLRKHGGSFAHALTVFRDPLAKTVPDEAHSETEERWFTIGCTPTGECLVVVHTWTEVAANTAKIRMISARKATHKERKAYEEGI